MAFEIFSAYGAAGRGEATLRASGYLFLSKALLRRIHGESAETVVLLYDAATDQLGVRLALPEDPTPAIRAASKEPSGIAVNVVPFLASYDLPKPKKKLRLNAKADKEMLVIDLKPLRLAALL